MLSLMRSGSAFEYLKPRSDRSESPPILPSTLNWLSPCLDNKHKGQAMALSEDSGVRRTLEKNMLRGFRCKFMR